MKKINQIALIIFVVMFILGCSSVKQENDTEVISENQTGLVETENDEVTRTSESNQVDNKETSNQQESSEQNEIVQELVQIENIIFQKSTNVLVVWQTSCPPCEIQLKTINALYEKFSDINFVGLGISESREIFDRYIEEKDLGFTNFYIDPIVLGEISSDITTTPTLLFMNQDGDEIRNHISGSQFTLEELDAAVEWFEEVLNDI